MNEAENEAYERGYAQGQRDLAEKLLPLMEEIRAREKANSRLKRFTQLMTVLNPSHISFGE